ncbi:hypothetical protein [Hymenobacter elongatus]|uniref:DUF3575 domain-containing protein n=1 Tax=Hymenobacter elongatus TaxID=877208 RepID=A0A4Z0PQX8_9BACT|nr:hypothetical protein [Hymenobacter elongatus]TGE19714.1 hypothetical protein E5J99_02840 [Hymenobacter elongatus]
MIRPSTTTRFICFTFLVLLALRGLGQATDPVAPGRAPKNIIKLAPLGFIHGQLPFSVESRLGFERVIGPHSSVAVAYSHLGTNKPFNFVGSVALSAAISTAFTAAGYPTVVYTDTKINTSGYRYQFQYKHYLSKKAAPEGLYLSPHFSYAKADYDIRLKAFEVAAAIKMTNSNYNLLFGFQDIWGKHFVVDVFTGLGYRDRSIRIFDTQGKLVDTMPKGTALKVSSGLNVGWAF